MRKLLNTLYVTTQGAYLSHEGESVVVRVDNETKLRVPIHTLGGIVCFGVVACSPFLMGLCAERGVAITHLTEYGDFLARVQGGTSGNVLLRRAQYRCADDPVRGAQVARALVLAKIANARTVLQRAVRDHYDGQNCEELSTAIRRLGALLTEVKSGPASLDFLRGKEGEAANVYFGVFDHLIMAQKDDFHFVGRSRRPPMDNINALLSFLYTLLVHDAIAALETVGLDPQVGFLHADRPGRPSLALDLIEEFRHFWADRLALSLINLRQVQGSGFSKTESGAVLMNDDTRKTVLVAYQKRKQDELSHPFIEESVPLGLLPFIQAQLLARYLRGDLDGYPPFIWR